MLLLLAMIVFGLTAAERAVAESIPANFSNLCVVVIRPLRLARLVLEEGVSRLLGRAKTSPKMRRKKKKEKEKQER